LPLQLLLGLPTLLLVLGCLSRACLIILYVFILVICSFHLCLQRVIQSAMSWILHVCLRFSLDILSLLVFPMIFLRTFISTTCVCPLIFILSGLVSHTYIIIGLTTLL
jgi:hypothetical protein